MQGLQLMPTAWGDTRAASLSAVMLHHHQHHFANGPTATYGGEDEKDFAVQYRSSTVPLSPRKVCGVAGPFDAPMSLKEVVDKALWSLESFRPESGDMTADKCSIHPQLSSSASTTSDTSETSSCSDIDGASVAKNGKKGGKKGKKAKNVIHGREDGHRSLQAGTLERMVQWILKKEVKPIERPSTEVVLSADEDDFTLKSNPEIVSATESGTEVEVSKAGRAFLVAYRQHWSAGHLLSLLEEYYQSPPIRRKKKYSISDMRRNCVSFLGAWVEERFNYDFYQCVHKQHQPPANSSLLKRLLSLLSTMAESFGAQVNRIKLMMLRRATEASLRNGKGSDGLRSRAASKPDILQGNTQVMAEQLTLIDSSMLLAIRHSELYNLAWRKNDTRKRTSPNIVAMVERFNSVSYWVASCVVMCSDLKKRISMVQRFVKLADACYNMRNFNSLMAILAGLNNAAVRRLKLTWAGLSESTMHTLEVLSAIMDTKSNYKNYREQLMKDEMASLPVVPYIGVYLRDLTFIDEGNPDRLNDLVNFEKLVMQGELILQISLWQRNGPYSFKPDGERQASLHKLLILPEDILFKKAEAIEPPSP